MSSSEASARCGRFEFVASRAMIGSKPLAKASCAVARMQTLVLTPAITTRVTCCSARKSARSVAKKALKRRL